MRLTLPCCALVLIVGCGGSTSSSRAPRAQGQDDTREQDAVLASVAAIHGGAGPWAVAGYRMGRFALARLGLPRGSFDLEVTHFTPHEVQYSCVADGAAAATGASAGRLNLSLEDATAAETRTRYLRRSTGTSVTLRLTREFHEQFHDVPRPQLGDAGRRVLGMRDEDIFEVVP